MISRTFFLALFFFLQRFTSAFLSPAAFHRTTASKVTCNAIPSSTFMHPFLLGTDVTVSDGSVPVGFEDAFSDEIVLFDPTIRLLLIGFAVFVLIAVVAKNFLNQMDVAIEKVLVEFENTMKENYQSRWVSIEAQLDGLVEEERSLRLFAIMEQLQESEPTFMEKVNRDMES